MTGEVDGETSNAERVVYTIPAPGVFNYGLQTGSKTVVYQSSINHVFYQVVQQSSAHTSTSPNSDQTPNVAGTLPAVQQAIIQQPIQGPSLAGYYPRHQQITTQSFNKNSNKIKMNNDFNECIINECIIRYLSMG